jgi:hypothetical protein
MSSFETIENNRFDKYLINTTNYRNIILSIREYIN